MASPTPPSGGGLDPFSQSNGLNALAGPTIPGANGVVSGVSLWGLITGDQASRAYFGEVGKRVGITAIGVGFTVVGFVLVVSGSKQAQSAISTVASVATKV